LERAAEIVSSYDTGVTLRQLFYRLVSEELLPNTLTAYKTLSARSAEARREGWFPALIDRGRSIHRYQTFSDPESAREWLRHIYRRDRTENQDTSIYLGVEKAATVEQLKMWFGELGLPILVLGGYSSQTCCGNLAEDVLEQDRSAVLLYAGDFDPSGEDIDRDFLERTNVFDKVIRVALNPDQVREYELPVQMGKSTDSRAAGFVRRHGTLVQVELDALPPDILRNLYEEAIEVFLDMSKWRRAVDREEEERDQL
jgi:hypothetical protein